MKIIVEISTETSPNEKRSGFKIKNFRDEVEYYLGACFDMDCFEGDYCKVEKIIWIDDEDNEDVNKTLNLIEKTLSK